MEKGLRFSAACSRRISRLEVGERVIIHCLIYRAEMSCQILALGRDKNVYPSVTNNSWSRLLKQGELCIDRPAIFNITTMPQMYTRLPSRT